MADDPELEDLEALVATTGWGRFMDYALRDLDNRLIQDMVSGFEANTMDLGRIQGMLAVREDRMRLLRWPHERIATIERAQRETSTRTP